ncbi:MAG TPA: dienelactone hydrolase family protein [Thermoanaerobaculia bacterium]|jgi:predicted esterase|nr:dienelactone hydrolase family protein [Thermoanaerobaculia bacterium]
MNDRHAPAAAIDPADPHRDGRIATTGEPLASARAAVILLHGRYASAENILTLADRLVVPGVAYLAPQAYESTWYPLTFLSPLESNEPGLSSALGVIDSLVDRIGAAGIPPERTLLLGFSQGACLATESAARKPRNYGAVIGFTGALLGPPGTPRDYPGSLAGVPVFLGAGDADPHVPWWRIEETAEVLGRMGAEVDLRCYPGLPHTVNDEELAAARALLLRAAAGS